MFFAAKDGEALYSRQKQDWELAVAQIMNSLFSTWPCSILSPEDYLSYVTNFGKNPQS